MIAGRPIIGHDFLHAAMSLSTGPLLGRWAGLRLRGLAEKCRSVQELVELAYTFSFGPVTIVPTQSQAELNGLLKKLSGEPIRNLLEIGTGNGGSLFLLSHTASPGATLVSLDIRGGPFGGGYPRWRGHLYRAFRSQGQRMFLPRMNSHEVEALQAVESIVNGGKLDLVFLDGDHSYAGVKRDLEIYAPLVRAGGRIVISDIVPGRYENVGESPRFWQEIRGQFDWEEIVDDWNQGSFGFGILRV